MKNLNMMMRISEMEAERPHAETRCSMTSNFHTTAKHQFDPTENLTFQYKLLLQHVIQFFSLNKYYSTFTEYFDYVSSRYVSIQLLEIMNENYNVQLEMEAFQAGTLKIYLRMCNNNAIPLLGSSSVVISLTGIYLYGN